MTERQGAMMIDEQGAYEAFGAKDARFDGVFFIGVSSTGIYCRPICPVRTPKREHCQFFASAEAAEAALFRPCLRCRPELAPGQAPTDQPRRMAQLLVNRINEGLADTGAGIEAIADRFGLSSRQLRRVVRQELGVSPIDLIQTRRLLLAKQLLTETRLPVIEVAYASGFSSLRRFNDAFLRRYRMPPSRLRRQVQQAVSGGAMSEVASVTVQLTYRPPYDWDAMLAFLAGRCMQGVERVADGTYARTVRLGQAQGWVIVRHVPQKRGLAVTIAHALTPWLPAVLGRLRHVFDLAARPDLIADHLAQDPRLRASVAARPGLRVPGAFDGFELAVRAVLGQQVSVKAATTLAGRLAEALGEPIVTPVPGLTRLAPTSASIGAAGVDGVAGLGVVASRARAIVALAEAHRCGDLVLEAGAPPDRTMACLTAIPGIGPWTAGYIAMRALRWPDAFPHGDAVVLSRLGRIAAREAEAMSRAWSPWRSYAVMHLWAGDAAG